MTKLLKEKGVNIITSAKVMAETLYIDGQVTISAEVRRRYARI